jgi:YgiT-type zinc finger domain-containing protein
MTEVQDWFEETEKECPRGCGTTLEYVCEDHIFTRPDGKSVLLKNAELFRCSVCGEEFTPGNTAQQVADFFQGKIEPSGVTEIPVFEKKSA